jgi:hypothetical protein
MKPIISTLQYLDAKHISKAVLAVYEENKKLESAAGFSADVENWWLSDELRQDLWKRTRDAWCQKVGRDFTLFPYAVDFVARLYARFSRASAKTRARWNRELYGDANEDTTSAALAVGDNLTVSEVFGDQYILHSDDGGKFTIDRNT